MPKGHQRGFSFRVSFVSLGFKCETPFLPESPEVCQSYFCPISQRLRAETRKVEASEHCPWCRGCGKLQSFREEACRWRLIEPLKNSSAPRAISEIREFSKAQTRLRGITRFGKDTAW